MYIRYTPNPPKALRAAPAGAKKPARAAPEALRNLGKPKIPVFLMVGVHCRALRVSVYLGHRIISRVGQYIIHVLYVLRIMYRIIHNTESG